MTTPSNSHSPADAPALGSEFLRSFGGSFDLIHEVEIRGSCDWRILAAVSDCLGRAGAAPVSLSARRFDDRAQTISCRVRIADEGALEEAAMALRAIDGITGVTLTHHLTRARAA